MGLFKPLSLAKANPVAIVENQYVYSIDLEFVPNFFIAHSLVAVAVFKVHHNSL